MAEKNIKLVIEYDGTGYAGWQSQKQQTTIQDTILEAVFKTTGVKVNLIGAGRTDAGVHALGQVANFRIDHRLEPSQYRDALNYYLPDDIIIKSAAEVMPDFNARRSAIFRRYRYLIGFEKSAIHRNLRWDYRKQLDSVRLNEAAAELLGEHDFTPFCVVASRKESNICRIDHSRWRRAGPLLVYEIRGNRFLHSMVRSLVGAMVNLATTDPDNNKLNLTLAGFKDIMRSNTDHRVSFTAPAHGLYLVSVGYSEE